ncbi:uncharacterized protein V6R79_012499 [Siganus canaliculatus]
MRPETEENEGAVSDSMLHQTLLSGVPKKRTVGLLDAPPSSPEKEEEREREEDEERGDEWEERQRNPATGSAMD